MPAKPLTPEQLQDAARLKEAFRRWRDDQAASGTPVSQHKVAEQLDMSQPALSQYLNGKIPLNGPALAKFAALIEVPAETISSDIAAQEAERSRVWSPSESALEQLAIDVFELEGVKASRTSREDRPRLPAWMAELLPLYTPDLRLDFEDGSTAWVEVKSPHAVELRSQQYVAAQAAHPDEFLLLMADAPDMQRVVRGWLARRAGNEQPVGVAEEPAAYPVQPRTIWVVGSSVGCAPDLTEPGPGLDEVAMVASADPKAFAVLVVGDDMVPRYMPGEYALIEPGTDPELEDDVLVRIRNGETMLRRLLSRRGGIRLGGYNTQEVVTYREEKVEWMYYVAHPVPARRIVRASPASATDVDIMVTMPGAPMQGSFRRGTRVASDASPPAVPRKPTKAVRS